MEFLGGNIILKIVILQVVIGALVLLLMKKLLDRELFAAALEQVSVLPLEHGVALDEIVVVAGCRLSEVDRARLKGVVERRYPQARLVVGEDLSLGGGLIIRVGVHVFDHSFWTRIKQLAGGCP
jgi:F0F1-type ATP synthase delta subunit